MYPSTFAGNKIFGYKVLDGGVHYELGLCYQDSGDRADIISENFMVSEKYDYVLKLNGDSVGTRRTIGGYPTTSDKTYTFFIQTSTTCNGAWKNYQQTVTQLTGSTTTLPVGKADWLTTQEFITLKQGDSDFTVVELLNHDEYNNRRRTFPNILATKGTTIKIHDLIGLDASTQLNFYDSSRTLITAGISRTDENNDVFTETIEVTVPSTVDDYYYYGYSANTSAKIIALMTTYFNLKVYNRSRIKTDLILNLIQLLLIIVYSIDDIIDVNYVKRYRFWIQWQYA